MLKKLKSLFSSDKNDKKHGQCTFTFSGGGKYVGEFKNGKWHGQGAQTLPDGAKYVGEFKGNTTLVCAEASGHSEIT